MLTVNLRVNNQKVIALFQTIKVKNFFNYNKNTSNLHQIHLFTNNAHPNKSWPVKEQYIISLHTFKTNYSNTRLCKQKIYDFEFDLYLQYRTC